MLYGMQEPYRKGMSDSILTSSLAVNREVSFEAQNGGIGGRGD